MTSNKKHQQQHGNKLKELEDRVNMLEQKNKLLEGEVEILKSQNAICQKVTTELTKELDKLSQYTRRSNVILKNVFLPETETADDVDKVVKKVIAKDLQLPNDVNNIDKLHRTGKIKTKDGKKIQDVIVRFKSHSSRYRVYNARKKSQNIKIMANLTPARSKLLYEANQLVENIDQVHFVFSDVHGNLKFRLMQEFDGKFVFNFFSLDELNSLFKKMGFINDA